MKKTATLIKKRFWHMCFPVNFVKFLRTPFFKEHLRWLLLLDVVLVFKERKGKYKRLEIERISFLTLYNVLQGFIEFERKSFRLFQRVRYWKNVIATKSNFYCNRLVFNSLRINTFCGTFKSIELLEPLLLITTRSCHRFAFIISIPNFL